MENSVELNVLSLQTGLLVRFCSQMHVSPRLGEKRGGVLELAIQTNVYGSLYVIFAERDA